MGLIINPYRYAAAGGGSNGLLNSLEAYWSLDESSGSTAADATGNGHDGTATGTTAGVSGIISNGRQFANYTSDVVTIPHDAALNNQEFSVSVWAYMTGDADSYVRILEKGGAVGGSNFGIEWNDAGYTDRVSFQVWNSGNYGVYSSALSLNTWYHIVVTFNGTTGDQKLYINGSLAASASSVVMQLDSSNLLLGKYAGDTFHTLDGTLDEVGYWSRVLDSTDVATLYNSGSGLAYSSFTA